MDNQDFKALQKKLDKLEAKNRLLVWALLGLLALCALLYVVPAATRPEPTPKAVLGVKVQEPTQEPPSGLVAVELVSVTDGDTIRVMLDGKEEPVRLIGIDTPEKWKKTGSGGWVKDLQPFALEASAFTGKSLQGRDIWLEYDVERRDKYDRVLAYVWAEGPDGTGKQLVNAQIVRQGLALLLTIPPNAKYVDRLKAALYAAKKDKLNLWAGVDGKKAEPAAGGTEREKAQHLLDSEGV
jgi:micrococcal nuclease